MLRFEDPSSENTMSNSSSSLSRHECEYSFYMKRITNHYIKLEMYADIALLIMKSVEKNVHHDNALDKHTTILWGPRISSSSSNNIYLWYKIPQRVNDAKTILALRATCKGACVPLNDLVQLFGFSFGRAHNYDLMVVNHRLFARCIPPHVRYNVISGRFMMERMIGPRYKPWLGVSCHDRPTWNRIRILPFESCYPHGSFLDSDFDGDMYMYNQEDLLILNKNAVDWGFLYPRLMRDAPLQSRTMGHRHIKCVEATIQLRTSLRSNTHASPYTSTTSNAHNLFPKHKHLRGRNNSHCMTSIPLKMRNARSHRKRSCR